MIVCKEEFQRALDCVAPGLSNRENLEQSGSIVFSRGRLKTFNDHVYCSAPSRLDKNILGSFPAKKFPEILRKIPDQELDVLQVGKRLLFRGEGR